MAGQSARGYSWPPFEPGNEAHLTHGAKSQRHVSPLMARLAAELLEVAPWCARPAYAAAVAAWSRVEAQLRLVSDYLDEQGLLDDAGKPRVATGWQDKLEARAAKLRAELGLTPMSLSRLLLTVAMVERSQGGHADSLELIMAEGRAALALAAEGVTAPGTGNHSQQAAIGAVAVTGAAENGNGEQ